MKIRKLLVNSLIQLMFVIFFISCSLQNNDTTKVNNEQTSGCGKVRFKIFNSTSRTIIPSETAQSLTDTYQIIIYNSSANYNEAISNDTNISVQEGTYNAVLLAKKKISNLESHAYGSSYVKNINVEEGKITEVTLCVLPFNITFECPETVKPGNSFSITKTVDTRNEVLFSRYLYKPKFQKNNITSNISNGVPSNLGSYNSASVEKNGTILTYIYTYVAGSNPDEDTEYLITDTDKHLSSIKIYDSMYNFELEEAALDWSSYGGYSTDFAVEGISYCNTTLEHIIDTGIGGAIIWGE